MSKSLNTAWIERYYGRDNQPNSRQLSSKIHFRDKEGREYSIAVKNDQILLNDRFNLRRDDNDSRGGGGGGGGAKRKVCIVDRQGGITLYVRLIHGASSWFSGKAIGKPLLLRRVDNDDYAYEVTLRSAFRYDQRRCAGTVVVTGLDPFLCEQLLNKRA
jgi:hypothetical protein